MNHGFLAEVACLWESTARKVGNVHPTRSFGDLEYMQFVLSASAIRPIFDLHERIGPIVLAATEATRNLVAANTNLGILLLLAPLASVRSLSEVLAALSIEDAECVYKAIRLASPGGLGDAPEQDVRDDPTVTLLEAMKLAADRDLIARQYANGFTDVFDFGVPAFLDAFAKFGSVEAAIVDSQLHWMATFPDSLIARKNGPAVAEDVRRRAAAVLDLGGIATAEGRAAGVALDGYLRSDGNRLNPGTTADLIAVCLFVALRENKIAPSAPFRWNAPDWL